MTVIVALPDRMYSDSRCTTDGDVNYPCIKIYRHKGELLGVAGNNRSIEKFVRWYKGSRKQMLDFNEAETGGDNFAVIVLNKRGIWNYDDCSLADRVERNYHGVGGGWPAAHAAMLAGADARRAIEIACEVNQSCGLPVQEFTL